MVEDARPAAAPTPEPAAPKKERCDAQKVSREEAADWGDQDISRPYRRVVCRACGKKFRTCAGGRVNCYQCSPATYRRRLFRTDPVMGELKAAVTEGGHRKEPGDLPVDHAPPEQVLRALQDLQEERLQPQTTEEAIALLARIGEHVARGALSVLRGRALTAIVRVQIGILQKQESLRFKEREAREREHRRRLAETKRLNDKLARERKAAEERARRRAEKKDGAKGRGEVPLPEMTDADRRLAEET